ncbi:MAG: GntR family transcriptional regulator [Paracoccaceae bacterium]
MEKIPAKSQTSSDAVFDKLFSELLSLEIKPLSTLSEADVASRFGVSRQPVRDAFNRLSDLGLLQITPQRPTLVRGFSMERIQNARFVRLTIELEVMKSACVRWDADAVQALEENLVHQRAAIVEERVEAFHALDYDFHRLICVHAGHPIAFETMHRCKLQVDRLCVLSLGRDNEVAVVLEDHENIARALRDKSIRKATRLLRRHASRLDPVIEDIHKSHGKYFD